MRARRSFAALCIRGGLPAPLQRRGPTASGRRSIGETAAQMLAHEGVAVGFHRRDRDRAEAIAYAIREHGGIAVVAIGDLADDTAVESIVQEGESLLGGCIDILVNNAGGSREKYL